MNVILTGSNGNLGSHIQKHADFRIHPLNREDWNDIDTICNEGIHTVIHTAYDLKKSIFEHPDEVLSSNIITTAAMLKKCQQFNIPNFVFISSCSVYGESLDTSEQSICTPVTLNGLTKLLNEKLVIDFCSKHGINFLILRVFNSYGGNDTFSVISKLLESVNSNKPFTLYDKGLAERDFIHIDDVAEITCKLVNKNLKNEIINIGTGKSVKIIDLINVINGGNKPLNIIYKSSTNEIMHSHSETGKLNQIIGHEFKDIIECIHDL